MSKLINFRFVNFYSPDDVESIAPNNKETIDVLYEDDKSDVIDLDEKKETKKDDKKDDDDKDEVDDDSKDDEVDEDDDNDEVDELDEIEEELKEPSDEDLELMTPVKRREILAKYPTFFKEFPYMERAYYREQQFTELFPTINDAKDAKEAIETLEKLDGDLSEGKTEQILAGLKTENPEAFTRVVDEYMETLYNIDKDSYYHVVGNIGKEIIRSMVKEAETSDNKELKSAAALVNQFLFATSEYTPPTKLSKPIEKKDNTVEEERNKWMKERFETEIGDLHKKIGNSLKNTVDAHIDKNKVMTDFVRKHAINEVMADLNTTLKSDKRFQSLLIELHKDVLKNKFSEESLGRVRNAWLSRAKSVLPALIKKARNEALKGMGKRVIEKPDNDRPDTEEKEERSHRSTPKNNGKDKDKIPAGMSTLDYLNS